jgi:hypothetical protein
MKGYCSDRAFDREFPIDSIHNLEAKKVGLGPIFGSWVWRQYYKHIMCSVAKNLDDVWMTLRMLKKIREVGWVYSNSPAESNTDKNKQLRD